MQVYNLGPDDPWQCADEEIKALVIERYQPVWIVTDYRFNENGYCGEGYAIIKPARGDKLLYVGLGHCSCYGPFGSSACGFTGIREPMEVTIDEVLNPTSVFDIDVSPQMRDMIRHLLQMEV
jgi:hypothetical protein